MDTKPTVEKIREAANTLRQYAKELDSNANKLDATGDFTLVAECLNAITNCFSNIRLDLFIMRPLREYEKELIRRERT